ncbi:MAG: hypothetical protein ACTSYB_07475 [Candidatus Helarchaeota archaeon]
MAQDIIYNFNLMIATTQLIVSFLCAILFFQEWRKQKRTENEQYIPYALMILYVALFIGTGLIVNSTFFTDEAFLNILRQTKFYFIGVGFMNIMAITLLIYIAERISRKNTKHFFLIYYLCISAVMIALKILDFPPLPGVYLILIFPMLILIGLFVYRLIWKTSGQIRYKMILVVIGFALFVLAFTRGIILTLEGEYHVYLEVKGLVLIASILTGYGFYTIPSFTELDWDKKIRHLYLLNTNGVCIFHHAFREKSIDQDLFGGSLVAIQSLMQEMIQSDKLLKTIDHEDAKILFEQSPHAIAIMIADEDLYIVHFKLQQLLKEFELLFGEIMERWTGNLDMFQPLRSIINKIFEIEEKGSE